MSPETSDAGIEDAERLRDGAGPLRSPPTRRIPTASSVDGAEQPRELLYARRMTETLERIAPDASEVVRLAARCQHIRRWTDPARHVPRRAATATAAGAPTWPASTRRRPAPSCATSATATTPSRAWAHCCARNGSSPIRRSSSWRMWPAGLPPVLPAGVCSAPRRREAGRHPAQDVAQDVGARSGGGPQARPGAEPAATGGAGGVFSGLSGCPLPHRAPEGGRQAADQRVEQR